MPFALTPPAVLDDLRARLRATRWPDAPADAGWSMGTDVDYLRDLVAYWADGFDWQTQEAALAGLPHSHIDGIHFVHVRSGRPGALPLLLTHGWPDSFWRYTKVIPLLADEFDLVVPDIPGFGYSDRPPSPLNSIEVAARFASLMTALGYERFGAAGGDIGSHVSRYLALNFPDRVVAVHRTDAGLPVGRPDDLSPAEQAWFEQVAAWGAAEGAYAAMHRTKPQTAAVGLNDSPAGLAAWIVEKMQSWSDRGVDGFTRDEILTNVMIYWLTGTIGSSMRMYRANAAIPPAEVARRVSVPSGFAIYEHDLVRPPRDWLRRTANVVRATELPRGGHFAAFEEPESYASELRAFFHAYG
jgi:pimeloyl-ACP methyl ester carboxylesterase